MFSPLCFIGAQEGIIVGAIVLILLIAPSQLPKLVGSMGESITKFKRGIRDDKEEISGVVSDLNSSVDSIKDDINSVGKGLSSDLTGGGSNGSSSKRPRGR